MKESNRWNIYLPILGFILSSIVCYYIPDEFWVKTAPTAISFIEFLALFVTIMGVIGVVFCLIKVIKSFLYGMDNNTIRYMLKFYFFGLCIIARPVANAILAAMGSSIQIGIFNPFGW